jgi:hypothetical protein
MGCEIMAATEFIPSTMPVSAPVRLSEERSQVASSEILIAWAKKYIYTNVLRKW